MCVCGACVLDRMRICPLSDMYAYYVESSEQNPLRSSTSFVSLEESTESSVNLPKTYERFDSNPDVGKFTDLLNSISDAIADRYDSQIKKLITKVNAMLNSENHNVPRHVIHKLGGSQCKDTDELFHILSPYIKPNTVEVLGIIVKASGCKKAINLYEDSFLRTTMISL